MNALCVPRALLVSAFVVVSSASVTQAQTASALLHEDDELLPGETISFLNNTAVNHVGGYACSMSTTGTATVSRIWGNASGGPGALMRSEGTVGDYEQTSFESFYGLGDGGELCYATTSNRIGDGTTGLDGVWLDDSPILHEQDPIGSIPGQFSSFNSRPVVTGDGVAQWSAGFTSTLGGSTQNRVLFRGAGLTPLIMGGDFLAGVAEPVSMTDSIDFNHRTSRLGARWIAQMIVDSASSVDGVMVINGSPISVSGSLMREGTAVPAAAGGLPGEAWASFDSLGVTESGAFLITGDTSAATSMDEFVFLTNQVVLREGAVLDLGGSPVTVSGAMEGAYLNEQGD